MKNVATLALLNDGFEVKSDKLGSFVGMWQKK